jgi:peptidylprolyl isomerase
MTLKAMTTAVAAAAVALGLAACGGSSKAGGVMLAPGGGPTNTTVATAPATTSTPTTTTVTVTTPTSGPLATEPVIKKPTTPAPKTLIIRDVIKGTGATAEEGDTVYVNYVGALYKNGKVFDASWKDTPGKAISFPLTSGSVIPGWVKGLQGMKVGGRRELIIPPSEGYGKSGSGSTIPPNSTLIFIVDLLKVTK